MKRGIKLACMTLLVLCVSITGALAATYSASDADAFYEVMHEQLLKQEESFTINFSGKASELTYKIYGWMLNADKVPTGADLQRELMARGDSDANYEYAALNLQTVLLTVEDGKYYFSNLTYHDSLDELAYVEERIAEIVEELNLEGQSDIAKIKRIYEYMTINFTYDYSYSVYSAYEGLTTGTMVCQGYSLITSRLLDEAGLNSRCIVGLSRGENHAWNMVELDGLWYSLDTTWDGTAEAYNPEDWNYFMKCDEDFVNHGRYDEFSSDEFLALHTLATESYEVTSLVIEKGGSTINTINIRLGVPVSMEVGIFNGDEVGEVLWSVGDSSLIDVSEDGEITGIALGSTWLEVSSKDDPSVAGDTCNVTVVDMYSMSSWATETITAYYLQGFMPASLCGEYQSDLTRAEMAMLIDQLVIYTKGYDFGEAEVPFEDIDHLDTDVWNAIGRCYASGLMNGLSDTSFDPDATVTREQVAAVLVRVQEYISGSSFSPSGSTQFTDSASISSWAVESVSSAQEQGLLQGDNKGAFLPKDTMTREQMIVALSRVAY